MKQTNYVKDHGSQCTITVDVTPGADRTEVVGTNPWRNALQIRIAAKAKEGQANAELLRFLAEKLDVPTSSIRIVKGERSTIKVIQLPVTAARAQEILGGS